MKKHVAAIAAATVGTLGATLLAAAPAEAVTITNLVVAHDHVESGYGDDCVSNTVVVTGDWGLYPNDNTIDVNVTGPYGDWAGGDFVVDDSTGRVEVPVELCSFIDERGTYYVDVEVTTYDASYNQSTATASTTFTYSIKRPAKSKIVTHSHRQRGKYPWAVTGVLKRDGRPYNNRVVRLQAKIEGYWFNIDKDRTRKGGKVAWQFKRNGYLWRFHFDGNNSTKPSSSSPFRYGRGRVAARTDAIDPSFLAELVSQ